MTKGNSVLRSGSMKLEAIDRKLEICLRKKSDVPANFFNHPHVY